MIMSFLTHFSTISAHDDAQSRQGLLRTRRSHCCAVDGARRVPSQMLDDGLFVTNVILVYLTLIFILSFN